jgi:hypothetical protein
LLLKGVLQGHELIDLGDDTALLLGRRDRKASFQSTLIKIGHCCADRVSAQMIAAKLCAEEIQKELSIYIIIEPQNETTRAT